MYGVDNYGIMNYGTNSTIPNLDIEKYKVNLSKYVPNFISELPEMKALYDAEGSELGILNYQLEDIKKQFHIDTATWGLDWWEDKYGIEINKLSSYEDRREVVKAKKRGRGTTTIAMLKKTAIAFSGGEANVIEHNSEYRFTIHFIGIKGIPRNMQSFKDMLEIIKPAHLAYDFAYTYNTWGMVKARGNWDINKPITWDEVRTY